MMSDEKMYEYKKLRGRIIEKFSTYGAFAAHIGVSQVTVSKKLNCQSGFRPEDIETWAAALDIPVAEYGPFFYS